MKTGETRNFSQNIIAIITNYINEKFKEKTVLSHRGLHKCIYSENTIANNIVEIYFWIYYSITVTGWVSITDLRQTFAIISKC